MIIWWWWDFPRMPKIMTFYYSTIRWDRKLETRCLFRRRIWIRSILSRQNGMNYHMEQNLFYWQFFLIFCFFPYWTPYWIPNKNHNLTNPVGSTPKGCRSHPTPPCPHIMPNERFQVLSARPLTSCPSAWTRQVLGKASPTGWRATWGPKGGDHMAPWGPKGGTISLMDIHWYSLMDIHQWIHWYSLTDINGYPVLWNPVLWNPVSWKTMENNGEPWKNYRQPRKNCEKQ